jgi:hypothetical protein
VQRRLRHIESAVRSSGCSECKDVPLRTYSYCPDEGEEKPEPEHCPSCGRWLGVILKLVYEDTPPRWEGGGG